MICCLLFGTSARPRAHKDKLDYHECATESAPRSRTPESASARPRARTPESASARPRVRRARTPESAHSGERECATESAHSGERECAMESASARRRAHSGILRQKLVKFNFCNDLHFVLCIVIYMICCLLFGTSARPRAHKDKLDYHECATESASAQRRARVRDGERECATESASARWRARPRARVRDRERIKTR